MSDGREAWANNGRTDAEIEAMAKTTSPSFRPRGSFDDVNPVEGSRAPRPECCGRRATKGAARISGGKTVSGAVMVTARLGSTAGPYRHRTFPLRPHQCDGYLTLDAPWVVRRCCDRPEILGRMLEPAAGRGASLECAAPASRRVPGHPPSLWRWSLERCRRNNRRPATRFRYAPTIATSPS
jgi:hypothetical protein